MHGSVVVLVFHSLQLKAFVVAFSWFPVLKYHHACHDVRSGNIGNIKGFDPFGRWNGKHFPKQIHNALCPFLLICNPPGLFKGIFVGQFNEAQIVSPLGDPEL